jgi:hypothetical protein
VAKRGTDDVDEHEREVQGGSADDLTDKEL